MALNEVRVWFYVDIEATKVSEIDKAINDLIDQIGSVETDLSWDNVDWEITRAPEPLEKEVN